MNLLNSPILRDNLEVAVAGQCTLSPLENSKELSPQGTKQLVSDKGRGFPDKGNTICALQVVSDNTSPSIDKSPDMCTVHFVE